MKYICFVDENDENPEVFVFPRSVHHDCFAKEVAGIRSKSWGNWERVYRRPISAGFVDPSNKCHGESETLNLKSRQEDTNILRGQLHNTRPLRSY